MQVDYAGLPCRSSDSLRASSSRRTVRSQKSGKQKAKEMTRLYDLCRSLFPCAVFLFLFLCLFPLTLANLISH
jgi:hypothetical protein